MISHLQSGQNARQLALKMHVHHGTNDLRAKSEHQMQVCQVAARARRARASKKVRLAGRGWAARGEGERTQPAGGRRPRAAAGRGCTLQLGGAGRAATRSAITTAASGPPGSDKGCLPHQRRRAAGKRSCAAAGRAGPRHKLPGPGSCRWDRSGPRQRATASGSLKARQTPARPCAPAPHLCDRAIGDRSSSRCRLCRKPAHGLQQSALGARRLGGLQSAQHGRSLERGEGQASEGWVVSLRSAADVVQCGPEAFVCAPRAPDHAFAALPDPCAHIGSMWRRSEGLPDTGPQRGHGSSLGGTLFDPPSLVGLRQVDLLHAIEQQTAQEFAGAVAAALPPHSDPTSAAVAAARAAGVDDAALHQDFAGLPKRSPRWWAALDTGEARQALQRRAVVAALSQLPGHGWDALDRCLITHAALVAGAYAGYHRAWLQAVQVGGSNTTGRAGSGGASVSTTCVCSRGSSWELAT